MRDGVVGGGFEVAPEEVEAAASRVREGADELARVGVDVGRLLQAMAAEIGGPATSAALDSLRGVALEASARLVAAVEALAGAMRAAATGYVAADRLVGAGPGAQSDRADR